MRWIGRGLPLSPLSGETSVELRSIKSYLPVGTWYATLVEMTRVRRVIVVSRARDRRDH